MEIDWDEILSKVEWVEFEYASRKFRVGYYVFEGTLLRAVELNIGSEAPTEDGWVGLSWCEAHGLTNDWPPDGWILVKLKESGKKPPEIKKTETAKPVQKDVLVHPR